MADTTGKSVGTLKALIANMRSLSERIVPTDLGELAQIHECALQMTQTGEDLGDPVIEAIGALARKVIEIAENIILETCANPNDTLALLGETLQTLDLAMETQDARPDKKIFVDCLAALNGQTLPPSDQPIACPDFPKPDGHATTLIPEISPYISEPLILSEPEFEYVKSFLTETQEHLENIEAGLLTLEQIPGDPDKINELFRPFHTIKGMAGFLNLRDIQSLTHEVETLLDLGRKGKLKITPHIIDLTFETLDVLKVQVQAIDRYMANPTGASIPQPPIGDLIYRVTLAARGIFIPAVAFPAEKGGSKKPIGEILTEETSLSPELVEFGLQQQKVEKKPVGAILTALGAIDAKDLDKALRKQQRDTPDTVVRVDTAKLDNLVNLVGELVIIQTQVEQNPAVKSSPKFARLIEQVSKITRDIQDVAMSMRMVPIGQTFHKMGRVLRDLSHKVGKKINYEIEGEETELDKNMIQELSDPLMHMIRNAVDHGIETPETRTQAGKPEAGTVKLRASHQAGNIVIEITDDGKGLDKDLLVRRAIEKGLIPADSPLTEPQAFHLIMAAGFSTAEKVTDISGRGVGMDVVRKNVEKLCGKIEIQSVLGQGSTFTLRLPLTLAVIDGMIVRVGTQKFVLPIHSIVQSLSPTADQLQTIQGRGQILNLRGQIYPLFSLRTLFNIPDALTDATRGMVVIAMAGEQPIGLVLDELLGQQQVVIKSLGERFKGVSGITGGTILGDGTVGLILEPAGLLNVHERSMHA